VRTGSLSATTDAAADLGKESAADMELYRTHQRLGWLAWGPARCPIRFAIPAIISSIALCAGAHKEPEL
jgi:hypothetical protein